MVEKSESNARLRKMCAVLVAAANACHEYAAGEDVGPERTNAFAMLFVLTNITRRGWAVEVEKAMNPLLSQDCDCDPPAQLSVDITQRAERAAKAVVRWLYEGMDGPTVNLMSINVESIIESVLKGEE